MCAAQIARMASNRLNQLQFGRTQGIDRYVSLAHSEGCGFGGESMYKLLHRTYRGYATHPNVAAALLLEHGCEKIPNDAMRRQFELAGLPLERFGWASVQLDGGIEKALENIETWFRHASSNIVSDQREESDKGPLSVGFLSCEQVATESAQVLASIADRIIAKGGSVLVPESDPLLASERFRRLLMPGIVPRPTLSYGESVRISGLPYRSD